MKIYGIKTCGSVKKALKYFNDRGIEYEFIDFKKIPPTLTQIQKWADAVGLKLLFNTKGTKYRTLKLKDMNLTDEQKIEWMYKEPLLVKRPVIEFEDKVIVAFDEALYDEVFV
jgi:Spx/MgsR family transcriptional regulator